MSRRIFSLLLATTFLAPTLLGFDSTIALPRCSKERDTTVWGIPVRVITKRFAVVENLKTDDFVLLENGIRHSLCGVIHNRVPSSIGILLDRSGSTGGPLFNGLALAKAGINQLLDTSGPEDEYFLSYADGGPDVQRGLTRDLVTIRSGLQISSKGKTSILDGIYSALQSMRGAHHINRALLAISDGFDNASTQTYGEIARLLSDSPIPVFLVIPIDPFDGVRGIPVLESEITARMDLLRLADGSGGYRRAVSDKKDMASAITAMAAAIRSPYVLYFEAAAGNTNRLGVLTIGVKGMRPAPILLYRGARRYTL